jgi:hypothetical protein
MKQGINMATIVFLESYFVYQHGQPEEACNKLLSLVKTSLNISKFHWKEYEEYINEI